MKSGEAISHSRDMARVAAREGHGAMAEDQDEQHLRTCTPWGWKQRTFLAELGLLYLLIIVERRGQGPLRDEIVVREGLDLLSRLLQGNILHCQGVDGQRASNGGDVLLCAVADVDPPDIVFRLGCLLLEVRC